MHESIVVTAFTTWLHEQHVFVMRALCKFLACPMANVLTLDVTVRTVGSGTWNKTEWKENIELSQVKRQTLEPVAGNSLKLRHVGAASLRSSDLTERSPDSIVKNESFYVWPVVFKSDLCVLHDIPIMKSKVWHKFNVERIATTSLSDNTLSASLTLYQPNFESLTEIRINSKVVLYFHRNN